jgi:uncharacterized protein (TIGR00251 family)
LTLVDQALQITENANGVYIPIQVQPRSSANKIRGIHDGRLKLAVDAAPVDGEATKQCLRYLAEIFSVANSRVKLMSGAQSRKKLVLIEGLTADRCREVLAPYLISE